MLTPPPLYLTVWMPLLYLNFEPRKVLKEFGLEISSAKSVCVHDSTADLRYFVLPEKPSNVADLSEEEIMKLISRDHLIGTAA